MNYITRNAYNSKEERRTRSQLGSQFEQYATNPTERRYFKNRINNILTTSVEVTVNSKEETL
jgi:hypothetical protein